MGIIIHRRRRTAPGDWQAAGLAATALFTSLLCASSALASGPSTPSAGCRRSCIEINDFHSEASPLHYSRSLSIDDQGHSDNGSYWRHGYEIRLTSDGDDRVIFDQYGESHRFQRQADGSYRATDPASGTLLDNGDTPSWTTAAGVSTEFQGSYPIQMHYPDGQSLRLDYDQGRLHSISDDSGEQILIEQEAGSAPMLHLPDGHISVLDSDPCTAQPASSPSVEDSPQCDTQANPAPGFQSISPPPGASTLDARPASCQSYFVDYYGTVRGEEIEAGIARLAPYSTMIPTNRSFPIVDFIDGEELIVVRSRDLASPSFNDPDAPQALHERLMRDGAQIQTRFLEPLARDGVLSRTEQGRTTHIVQTPSQHLSLHVLIRQGMASPAHWVQIERARADLLERYGIELQLVIIP